MIISYRNFNLCQNSFFKYQKTYSHFQRSTVLNAEYMSMLYNTLEMWDFISFTFVRALFPGNIFFSRSVLIPTFVTIQLSLFQKL